VLTELSLFQFRSFPQLELCLEPGATLFLGANGAGKTSLLEAAYLLATTKSFRTAQVADGIRHGEEGFFLRAEVQGEARTRLELAHSREGRSRLVNSSEVSLAEHLAVQPVVAWSALDVETITGAPSARRRLLDRGVLGLKPTALEVLGRCRQALAAKRALLLGDGDGLEVWNSVLASAAAELASLRAAYFEQLAARVKTLLDTLPLPLPPIELRYRPSPPEALAGPVALEEALARRATEERRRGLALLGPQRDDIEILVRGTEARRVASAGERKALSLVLALAGGQVLEAAGRAPVYLFDDLDAELSREMLASLWPFLRAGRQVLATSNRPEVWASLAVDRERWVVAGDVTASARLKGPALEP
jgi:DNA replication and repair protein RecF